MLKQQYTELQPLFYRLGHSLSLPSTTSLPTPPRSHFAHSGFSTGLRARFGYRNEESKDCHCHLVIDGGRCGLRWSSGREEEGAVDEEKGSANRRAKRRVMVSVERIDGRERSRVTLVECGKVDEEAVIKYEKKVSSGEAKEARQRRSSSPSRLVQAERVQPPRP